VRNPGGYAIWTYPDGKNVEQDSFTCVHCNQVVFIKPQADLGGFCIKCMKNVCGPCADLGVCHPFEKKVEAMEKGKTWEQIFKEVKNG